MDRDVTVKGEARAAKVERRRRAMPVNGRSVFTILVAIAKRSKTSKKGGPPCSTRRT